MFQTKKDGHTYLVELKIVFLYNLDLLTSLDWTFSVEIEKTDEQMKIMTADDGAMIA